MGGAVGMMAGSLTCAGDVTVRGEEYTVGTWRETQDATSWLQTCALLSRQPTQPRKAAYGKLPLTHNWGQCDPLEC